MVSQKEACDKAGKDKAERGKYEENKIKQDIKKTQTLSRTLSMNTIYIMYTLYTVPIGVSVHL